MCNKRQDKFGKTFPREYVYHIPKILKFSFPDNFLPSEEPDFM